MKGFNELGKRLMVSGVGIPLLVAGIFSNPLFLFIIVIVIQSLAAIELYRLASLKQFSPNKPVGIALIFCISLAAYLDHFRWIAPVILILFFILMCMEMFRGTERPLANMGITLFGAAYLGLFASFLCIRSFPERHQITGISGSWLVMQILLTIWICDTAAYMAGSRFGKHKLFPRVSPKKSWEGGLAGLLISIPAALAIRAFFLPASSVMYSIALGLIAGILGQIGDLIESFLKREAGVKDSSNLLPGHGGFLDRFDSPMIVAPFAYLFMALFGIGV